MRARYPSPILVLAALSLGAVSLAGCLDGASPPCLPQFGVYEVGAGEAPDSSAAEVCPTETETPTCALSSISADGEAFTISHQLPRLDRALLGTQQVVTTDKLLITLETPCGTTTRELEHDQDGLVEATLAAPAGAACALSVTASIANDSQTCTLTSANCDELDSVCEAAEASTSSETGTETG